MIKRVLAGIVIILSFVHNWAFGGERDKKDNLCIRGKWIITSVKYDKSFGMIILQPKKAKEEAEKLSGKLEGGTITFIEGNIVQFAPAEDTAVYTGKLSIKEYGGRQASGMDHNGNTRYTHGKIGEEMLVKFIGKGARYNFAVNYDCPRKNSPDEFKGKNYAGYIAYEFAKAGE